MDGLKILQQLGTDRSLEFMRTKLGFTTLDDRDNDLAPLGVGSLTNGVHLDELTAAFATFGNGGYYYEPITYERVEDTSGNLVLDIVSALVQGHALEGSNPFVQLGVMASVFFVALVYYKRKYSV